MLSRHKNVFNLSHSFGLVNLENCNLHQKLDLLVYLRKSIITMTTIYTFALLQSSFSFFGCHSCGFVHRGTMATGLFGFESYSESE